MVGVSSLVDGCRFLPSGSRLHYYTLNVRSIRQHEGHMAAAFLLAVAVVGSLLLHVPDELFRSQSQATSDDPDIIASNRHHMGMAALGMAGSAG